MKKEMATIIRRGLDTRIPALAAAAREAQRPARGWLRAARSAAALSQEHVAQKLGIKRQSYSELEKAEERGAISLNSLQRSAEAMGCHLVYYIVPREGGAATFSELALVNDPNYQYLRASEHSMALEDQAVGDLGPPPKPAE